MTLVQLSFLLLAAGACGGVLFAVLVAFGVRYPAWFGAGHGLLGLAAVGLLAYALLQGPAGAVPARAWWALGVFTAALAGGFTFFKLLFPDRRPLALALLHGALALAGLYLLYPLAFDPAAG